MRPMEAQFPRLLEALELDAPAHAEWKAEVTALFDAYRNPLLRFILSLGLPMADAEEVIQEVFLALFEHLRAGKPRGNLRGFRISAPRVKISLLSVSGACPYCTKKGIAPFPLVFQPNS